MKDCDPCWMEKRWKWESRVKKRREGEQRDRWMDKNSVRKTKGERITERDIKTGPELRFKGQRGPVKFEFELCQNKNKETTERKRKREVVTDGKEGK